MSKKKIVLPGVDDKHLITPATASDGGEGSALSDEQAEALANENPETKVDELGIPFYFPENYGRDDKGVIVDGEKAKWAGKRIPANVRRFHRKRVKDERAKTKAWLNEPVPRKEILGLTENIVNPMSRQAQALTFRFMALERVLFRRDAKITMRTEESGETFITFSLDQYARELKHIIVNYRVKALKMAMKQENVDPDSDHPLAVKWRETTQKMMEELTEEQINAFVMMPQDDDDELPATSPSLPEDGEAVRLAVVSPASKL